jgi:hypothetical protein
MVDDAEIQSRRLIADAEADARRRGESERRRLEEEILDLATRRDTLLADVEALTRFEADYRDRSVRALEADLAALRSRPPASPGVRPEPSDVEIPAMSNDYSRREEASDPFASPPSAPSTSHPAAFQPAGVDTDAHATARTYAHTIRVAARGARVAAVVLESFLRRFRRARSGQRAEPRH